MRYSYYIPILVLFIYWLLKYYDQRKNKKRSFDKYYNDVLTSDKYKVKSKFESD